MDLPAALKFRTAVAILLMVLLGLLGSGVAQEPARAPRGDLRIAVFGDFNGPFGSLEYPRAVARTVHAMTEVWRPDLLLSPGDVIAGQSDSLPPERFAQMWAAFDGRIAAPLRAAGIPYAVAVGNHDGSSLRTPSGSYRFARERKAALEYWDQEMYEGNLAYVDRDDFPFNYSFRFGDLFVVVLDASSARVDEEQRRWLAGELGRAVAESAAVRIVVGHLPLVPIAVGRAAPGEYVTESSGLRRILEAGGVDLYLSGHQAAYYPGRLGELELLFAGGVGARRLLGSDAAPRSTVTLIDICLQPLEIRYTTFDVANWETVSATSLPRSIDSGVGTVEISGRATGSSATLACGLRNSQ